MTHLKINKKISSPRFFYKNKIYAQNIYYSSDFWDSENLNN
jgi:hypothetical protein